MPDRPLIVLPAPAAASRSRLPGGGANLHLPGRGRQGQRLGPRFETLRVHFEQRSAEIRASAAGQMPEDVIVFETIGSIANFVIAASRIRGFDFLGEWDVEDIAPDDDFQDKTRPENLLGGRVFLVMSNQQALKEMLRLWHQFTTGRGSAPTGLAPFYELFRHLKDVRRWSIEDRLLDTGVLEYWKDAAEANDGTPVPFEIELWFRSSGETRGASVQRVGRVIARHNGQIVNETAIEPIGYHAIVASLPASEIRQLIDRQDVRLLGDSSVMFFRPSGQAVVPGSASNELSVPAATTTQPAPTGLETVAMLDGMPLENHQRLAGRLRVDDPDGYASSYAAAERHHGTTMASVIIYGDLNLAAQTLRRPLYVRPILRPDPQAWNISRDERIPFGVNALDLTYRVVRRLFEGEGQTPAVAPSVRIINLSIGDPLQQFHSSISAWGRLLDWLALKYNVLFCVSAGNHGGPVTLDVPRTSFTALNPAQREVELLKALYRDVRLRRILSPSDSINALTVGAWHHDFGPVTALPYRIDVLASQPLPSPINGLGCGFRNATKPDVLLPGGRQCYTERLGTTHQFATLDVSAATVAPGILAASASSVVGQVNAEKHTCGTSHAAALATRCSAFLYEQLQNLRNEPGGERLSDEFTPALLKAMLIHTAGWGDAYDFLRGVLKPADMREDKFKRIAARFLGYGFVSPFETLSSADHRATMLGCGELSDGAAHEYEIPLPPSLNAVRGTRRIIMTLTHISPIHPKHRNYRRAAVWFEVENGKLQTKRKECEWRSARNGTVQHEIFEGERAVALGERSAMRVKVNCRADAEPLEQAVRYGMVISIETAESLGIPVYNEIALRVRPAVTIREAV